MGYSHRNIICLAFWAMGSMMAQKVEGFHGEQLSIRYDLFTNKQLSPWPVEVMRVQAQLMEFSHLEITNSNCDFLVFLNAFGKNH